MKKIHCLLLVSSLAVGCGDDDGSSSTDANNTTKDGSTTDGGVPANPFELSREGGIYRVTTLQTAVDQIRFDGQALFFKNQDPAARSFAGVEIPGVDLAFCADYRSGDHFDDGDTPEQTAIINSRTYIDLGETASVTPEGGDALVFPKYTDAKDRVMGNTHDILYQADPEDEVPTNVWYSLGIDGSEERPSLDDLTDGHGVLGTPFDSLRIFMPPAYDLTTPTEEDFYDGLTINPAEGLELAWTAQEDRLADSDETVALVSFMAPDGAFEFACVSLFSDGNMTLPPEMLELVSDTGKIFVIQVHHVAYRNPVDDSRIDTMGAVCKVADYTKAE